MTKILSIGLGGVGAIAAFTLQQFNDDVQVTAVIRSDYDLVTSKGYTISSCDYGGISSSTGQGHHEPENDTIGFKPKHVVKSIKEAVEYGPFDYIVVCTKVIPNGNHNVWDDVIATPKLWFTNQKTSIVLIQNGIDIEKYWSSISNQVTLISGVSYISSVNNGGHIMQYNSDILKVGLFLPEQDIEPVEKFVKLYSNDKNSCTLDKNVRLTRWKKLLYNASLNTVCCLTNLDVGHVYHLGSFPNVIEPLMQEVRMVANLDLKQNYHSSELVEQIDVDDILDSTQKYNVNNNYQPSMLVDLRQGRSIELEAILGNIVSCYKSTATTDEDIKLKIPYLNLLTYFLTMVQYRIKLEQESS